jgi:hypothetical protein
VSLILASLLFFFPHIKPTEMVIYKMLLLGMVVVGILSAYFGMMKAKADRDFSFVILGALCIFDALLMSISVFS